MTTFPEPSAAVLDAIDRTNFQPHDALLLAAGADSILETLLAPQ